MSCAPALLSVLVALSWAHFSMLISFFPGVPKVRENFVFVEPPEVPVSPFLQPVKVWVAVLLPAVGTLCKIAESALYPIIH